MSRPDLLQAVELHSAGRLDEAVACYEAILAAAPRDPTVRFHLALALIAQRKPDNAAAVLAPTDAATSPAGADVYFHLAMLFQAALRPVQAAEWFERALVARPSFVAAQFNFGLALQNQGRLIAAADHYRKALERQPDLAPARHNLALMLQMLGRHGEAVDLYQSGLDIAAHATEFARYAVTAAFYDPGHTDSMRFALAEQFGRLLDRSTDKPRKLQVSADPQRRLRIGYITSDFCDHPIARNVEPLLIDHNLRDFETIAYADIERPDATTERLRGAVDLWRSIRGLSDTDVADLIQTDGIDILVCLAAHFDRNRPLVCASRPAPIQVSFHDVTTSASRAFDYLIADRIVCPAKRSEEFRERVVRLPSIYVHAPLEEIPPPASRPNARPITFGCLNNPAKLNNGILALWARIMAAVPDSRLILKYGRWFEAGDLQARILSAFAAFDVSAGRLEFLGGQDSRAAHLAHYNRIDIALDPYPFGGSTATFEALWMGVPVVTFAGSTMMSRWSASILKAIRLEQLIANTSEGYVAIALGLAQNEPVRHALRAELRERVRRSPLCDGPLRARQIERIYRALWRRWCMSAVA
jgi:protein O-GlcNAc transferase